MNGWSAFITSIVKLVINGWEYMGTTATPRTENNNSVQFILQWGNVFM